jgi:hypothetical protein
VPFTSADLDAMLAGAGEPITLGADTAYGVVRAVDTEELKDEATRKMWGTPLVVTARAFEVAVRTGTLTALKAGATCTIRSLQYVVDQVLTIGDGNLTKFLAYPVV